MLYGSVAVTFERRQYTVLYRTQKGKHVGADSNSPTAFGQYSSRGNMIGLGQTHLAGIPESAVDAVTWWRNDRRPAAAPHAISNINMFRTFAHTLG